VTVPLRPGADGGALVRELASAVAALSRASASCHTRSKAHAAAGCSVHRWEVTHSPPGAGHAGRHRLTIEAAVPLARPGSGDGCTDGSGTCADCDGGGGGAAGRVVVVKEGPLLPSEKALITRAVRAANLSFADEVG
jgi:hypothetical protein